MTRIDAVRVEGLAGRPGMVSFEFNSDVNVLFGTNGRGKTSLLNIIYSAVRNDLTPLRGIAFLHAEVDIYSRSLNRRFTRSISRSGVDKFAGRIASYVVDSDGNQLPVQASSQSPWKSSISGTSKSYAMVYLNTARLLHSAYNRATGSGLDDGAVDRFAQTTERLWRTYANKSLAEVSRIQQSGLASILEQSMFGEGANTSIRRTITPQKAYERTSTFLQRQNSSHRFTRSQFIARYTDDETFQELVAQVDRIEMQIERAEEPTRRLKELVDRFFDSGKTLDLTGRGLGVAFGDSLVPMQNLSSGEKQLIRILLEAITAEDNALIIDEPELSMHIDWQRELLGAIKTVNPDAQLIVATHSPEIMARVPDGQIFGL